MYSGNCAGREKLYGNAMALLRRTPCVVVRDSAWHTRGLVAGGGRPKEGLLAWCRRCAAFQPEMLQSCVRPKWCSHVTLAVAACTCGCGVGVRARGEGRKVRKGWSVWEGREWRHGSGGVHVLRQQSGQR